MNELLQEMNVVIPILQRENVQSTAFALRLTPHDKYGDAEIKAFLTPFEYIYVNEVSKKKKPHSHIVLFTELDEDALREKIREFLKLYFTEKPKQGDANKQYNLSEVDDIELAVTYILKDGGQYFQQGLKEDVIEDLKKKSFRKFSKAQFQTELERLKKAFKDNDTGLDIQMNQIVQLKSLYRQPVNLNQIYQMCLSFHIHNKPTRSDQFVSNFLSKVL